MKPVDNKDFINICRDKGINIPDENLGIGKDLSFDQGPLRTIVIHFGKDDSPDYLRKILTLILDSVDKWLFVPRFRIPSIFTENHNQNENLPFSFEVSNLDTTIKTMVGYRPELSCIADDVGLLSICGNILIKYDHHFQTEGLSVFLNDIELCNSLLISLNKIGTELELYYINCEQGAVVDRADARIR